MMKHGITLEHLATTQVCDDNFTLHVYKCWGLELTHTNPGPGTGADLLWL